MMQHRVSMPCVLMVRELNRGGQLPSAKHRFVLINHVLHDCDTAAAFLSTLNCIVLHCERSLGEVH